MKALTIQQPYASLVVYGAKPYETRSRRINYRGRIAIHAGLTRAVLPQETESLAFKALGMSYVMQAEKHGDCFDDMRSEFVEVAKENAWKSLPYGAVIGTADLVECWEIVKSKIDGDTVKVTCNRRLKDCAELEITKEEYIFGDWSKGRYALELQNIEIFDKPIAAKGNIGLWNWE